MEKTIQDIIKEHEENNTPIGDVGYCEYCYRVFPLDQLIEDEIWINGSQRSMLFCSKEHSAYCQMGAEG
jgi:hypothetical protein